MNLIDLELLVISFEIDKVKEYLRHKQQEELQKRGIGEIQHISGEEAMKM